MAALVIVGIIRRSLGQRLFLSCFEEKLCEFCWYLLMWKCLIMKAECY